MSAPKHTPGPWQWFKGERGGFVFFTVSGVANLTPAYVTATSAAAEAMQANAYLITAAPDLLAALREVVAVFESNPDSITDTVWVTGDRPETLYDCCRAAIAKAEGGAA